MNTFKIKHILTLLFVISATLVKADVFDEVINAFKTQNTKEVIKYLNSSVELTILDNDGVYSKQQAEIILKSFFNQNPPKTVTMQHRGSSGQGSKYGIAVYETNIAKYRIYVFIKEGASNTNMIHEMRIEKE